MNNNMVKYIMPYLDGYSFLLLNTLNNNICLNELQYKNIGEILDMTLYNYNKEIYISQIEVKTIEIIQKHENEFRDVLQKVINEINSENTKLKTNK